MPARHPTVWLMTDERQGEALWTAIERLPRGAGIVFRHYGTEAIQRRVLFEAVRRIARKRGLLLVLAGSPRQAAAWRADGAHGRSRHRRTPRPLLRTTPCHDRPELLASRDADVRFVSPLFPTRSHPGAESLGKVRAGLMVAGQRRGLIALGGLNARRYESLCALGFVGWAAIDAWTN